jgi:iron complex outermembrane receptor protein
VNPSDTGNIRITSLWHLSDKLRLSVDPSFQYVLANGGGTSTITETPVANNADRRVVGNTALAGFDLERRRRHSRTRCVSTARATPTPSATASTPR